MELEVGSSEWWLRDLGQKLDKRRPNLLKYRRYVRGDHDLGYASDRFQQQFGGLFENFSDNFMKVVTDSVAERTVVSEFRMGGTGGKKKAAAKDKEAWRLWQANNMDAMSDLLHQEILATGFGYVLVWDDPDEPDTPMITVEDPLETIVAFDAGNLRRRSAALKRWRDDSGFMYATLYLPDRIEKYQSQSKIRETTSSSWLTGRRWVPRASEGDEWEFENDLGVVPMVPYLNDPDLKGNGYSEIETIIPVQDAINKTVADMLVNNEFAAFIQRWATGVEVPIDPETKKPIETFKAAVDRLFMVPSKDAKFGEFSQADPKSFVGPIELFVQHIATQTRTPPHYFNASMGSFPSGESLKATETGLVKKCQRKTVWWSESDEEVMRLAMRKRGYSESFSNAQTVWADMESRTESEHIDALMKKASLGMPLKALWEQTGASPQEIERWEAMLADGEVTIYDLQSKLKKEVAPPQDEPAVA